MSTDITSSALSIAGYRGQSVQNSFLRQESDTHHLAIILPGYSYGSELPALYYPSLIMLAHGADVLRVRYAYDREQMFHDADAEERGAWIGADVGAAVTAGLAQRDYHRITLIGKSLGTIAMAYLLDKDERMSAASCIWLTPLLNNERLRQTVITHHPRSFFAIGTADPVYDQDVLQELVTATGGTQVVIEGANHGLEIQGDVRACLDVMKTITEAIDSWV